MASIFSSLSLRDWNWSPTSFLSKIRTSTSILHPVPPGDPLLQSSPSQSSIDSSSSSSSSFSSSLSLSSSASSRETLSDPSEIDDLRRIFDHFDENKDGSVSHDELRRSLRMFGIETDDAELVAMVAAADTNSDGLLDFMEFASFYYNLNEGMSRKINGESTAISQGEGSAESNEEASAAAEQEEEEERNLRDAFELFDKNSDGFICAEELQSVLKSMGLKQGKLLADCKDMIRSVDIDGDGQVSFHEFKRMMQLGLIR